MIIVQEKNLLWEIFLVDFVHKTWSLKSPEEKEIGLEKKVELYTIVRKRKRRKKTVCQYILIIDLKEKRKHFLSETLLLTYIINFRNICWKIQSVNMVKKLLTILSITSYLMVSGFLENLFKLQIFYLLLWTIELNLIVLDLSNVNKYILSFFLPKYELDKVVKIYEVWLM